MMSEWEIGHRSGPRSGTYVWPSSRRLTGSGMSRSLPGAHER